MHSSHGAPEPTFHDAGKGFVAEKTVEEKIISDDVETGQTNQLAKRLKGRHMQMIAIG